MHKNNFVAVVKCNEKILRERQNNIVYLPFGSEYSLSLKNLEDRKASVDITIDGKSVFEDCSYILRAGKECEIERFFGDNLDSGNRFKFIKKTSEIVQHRGDRVDDGLICIQFTFEKQQEEPVYTIHHTYHHHHDYIPACSGLCWNCRKSYCPWKPPQVYYNANCIGPQSFDNSRGNSSKVPRKLGESYAISSSANYSTLGYVNVNKPLANEGITVKGSLSQQQFTEASIGSLENITYTITFQLKGYTEKALVVEKPITTREKLICPTCGLACTSDSAYCKRCGTYL